MIREGGCLCGAVRFKAEGEPSMSASATAATARRRWDRRSMPAPVRPKALTVEGETAAIPHRSARPGVLQACGTRLFSWRTDGHGGRRVGRLRRPQRLCADRAHLGREKMTG